MWLEDEVLGQFLIILWNKLLVTRTFFFIFKSSLDLSVENVTLKILGGGGQPFYLLQIHEY